MDDFGPMYAAQMGFSFIAPFLTIAAALPIVIYIVARWRLAKDGVHDPQVGFKTAVSFFRVTAYQITLVGTFLLLYGMMSDMPDRMQSEVFRTAMGLLVPALAIWVLHFIALAKTNHAEIPMVARMFQGLQLVQTGIIGFFALVFACVISFQKGDSGEAGKAAWSMVMVYDVAWAAQAFLFARDLGMGPPPPQVADWARRPAPPGTPPPVGPPPSAQ